MALIGRLDGRLPNLDLEGAIVKELKKFDAGLAAKPRWLVLNKRDLLPDAEAQTLAAEVVRRLRYRGPRFLISAATHRGTRELADALMRFLEEQSATAPRAQASMP